MVFSKNSNFAKIIYIIYNILYIIYNYNPIPYYPLPLKILPFFAKYTLSILALNSTYSLINSCGSVVVWK